MATRTQHLAWNTPRTPIRIIVSDKTVTCWRCRRTIKPNVIDTQYLSKPLRVCPCCHSVLQNKQNKEEKTDAK
jgi:hypothetical protein